jgi:hypothetical protein
MTQAKGILPIREDGAMRSPNAEGYFIYGSLDPSLTRDALSAGVDRLFDPVLGVTTILKSGFFYVPPHDDRFLGASLFDAPKGKGTVKTGQVSIRKRVVDASGVRVRVERGGFQFQLLDSSGNMVSEFVTDSKGHAQSGEVSVGTYTLHEVPPDPARQIQPAPDQTIELKSKHEVVQVRNSVTQPNPPYGSQ